MIAGIQESMTFTQCAAYSADRIRGQAKALHSVKYLKVKKVHECA